MTNFKHNEDIKNSKIDATINNAITTIKYWSMLKDIQVGYQFVTIPIPSPNAYSSIQRLIETFRPDDAKALKTQFASIELPTTGFDSQENN